MIQRGKIQCDKVGCRTPVINERSLTCPQPGHGSPKELQGFADENKQMAAEGEGLSAKQQRKGIGTLWTPKQAHEEAMRRHRDSQPVYEAPKL